MMITGIALGDIMYVRKSNTPQAARVIDFGQSTHLRTGKYKSGNDYKPDTPTIKHPSPLHATVKQCHSNTTWQFNLIWWLWCVFSCMLNIGGHLVQNLGTRRFIPASLSCRESSRYAHTCHGWHCACNIKTSRHLAPSLPRLFVTARWRNDCLTRTKTRRHTRLPINCMCGALS